MVLWNGNDNRRQQPMVVEVDIPHSLDYVSTAAKPQVCFFLMSCVLYFFHPLCLL